MVSKTFPFLGLGIIIIIISMYSANADVPKLWPDLTCQEHFDNETRAKGLESHRASWEQCQIPTNETGQCAKVCQLKAHDILTFYGSTEWVVFEPIAAARYYSEELGIQPYNEMEDQRAETINRNILIKINACEKQWTKKFLKWDIKGPCDKWAEFLECLDKAYKGGC